MLVPNALTNTSLVPLGRFGALLLRERSRLGVTLAELSRSTQRRWLPDQLLEIERGRFDLSDDEVALLCEAYAIEAGPWPGSATCRLVLDRTRSSEFGRPSRSSAVAPETLAERFLALAVMIGLDVTTGSFGLEDLAEALDMNAVDTFALLEQCLIARQASLGATVDSLRSQLTVPSVGLLVGDTHDGTLVITASPW